MKKLYPIFVNFNSGVQLRDGVKEVLKSSSVAGVIIVDNGSIDESMEYLNQIKSTKKLIIIRNKENLGFYRALNVAIKKALDIKVDMIMPLDFDLEFSFDFITKLSKVDGDIIAPALKSKMNNKWFYDYGGRINWMNGTAPHVIRSTPRKNGIPISTSVSKAEADWIDFVSGGCTIIKKDVLLKLGKFDEDYFVYWGDAEYCLRAREAGFKVVMDGSTVVQHNLEISRQTKAINKLKISFFDNIMFIRKNVKWYFKPMAYLNIFLFSIKISLRLII